MQEQPIEKPSYVESSVPYRYEPTNSSSPQVHNGLSHSEHQLPASESERIRMTMSMDSRVQKYEGRNQAPKSVRIDGRPHTASHFRKIHNDVGTERNNWDSQQHPTSKEQRTDKEDIEWMEDVPYNNKRKPGDALLKVDRYSIDAKETHGNRQRLLMKKQNSQNPCETVAKSVNDDFYTSLERDAICRSAKDKPHSSKNRSDNNQSCAAAFHKHSNSTDVRAEKTPNSTEDEEILSTSDNCNADNFDAGNLVAVLGKEHYQRLMKNFEESEWISSGQDTGRDVHNVFLNDLGTDITVGNMYDTQSAHENVTPRSMTLRSLTYEGEKEEELGMHTHRPSDNHGRSFVPSNTIDTTKIWADSDVNSSGPCPSKDNNVKCAFSVEEIYAEAGKVPQAFVFKEMSDSNSDSETLAPLVRHNTSTFVFSASDQSPAVTHQSEQAAFSAGNQSRVTTCQRDQAVSKPRSVEVDESNEMFAHRHGWPLENSPQKSLEGREVLLPRQRPFGPVPQLSNNRVDTCDSRQDGHTLSQVLPQDDVHKSTESDKHVEGVRQYVEQQENSR